jgi:hypothetical protein
LHAQKLKKNDHVINFFFHICDVEILTKFSPKIEKLIEITLEKRTFPNLITEKSLSKKKLHVSKMDKCNVRKVAKDQGHQAKSFSKEDNCQPLVWWMKGCSIMVP